MLLIELIFSVVFALEIGYDLGRVRQGYLPTVFDITLTVLSVAFLVLSIMWTLQEATKARHGTSE